MKHNWTYETAKAWVSACEIGTHPKGLTYCSAKSWLNAHKPKEDKLKDGAEK